LQREESLILLKQLTKINDDNRLSDVAAELGDHPLALQLAGHFLSQNEQVDPAHYLEQLRAGPPLSHTSLQGEFSRYSPTAHELHVGKTFRLSYEQLNPSHDPDRQALALLARAACFAPEEPIPKRLLMETMPEEKDKWMAEIKNEDGLARLLSLGLLEAKGHEIFVMHRLLAFFTQQVIQPLNEARRAVETRFVSALSKLPLSQFELLSLPIPIAHLHHLTDIALQRADLPAADLAFFFSHYLHENIKLSEAESYAQKACRIRRERLDEGDPDIIASYILLGNIYWSMQKYEEAESHLKEALTRYELSGRSDRFAQAEALISLGHVYYRLGNQEQAYAYFREVLELGEEIFGPDHHVTAAANNGLGTYHLGLAQYKKSHQYFEAALATRLKLLGEENVHTAFSLSNVGITSAKLGDHDASRRHHEHAIAILNTLLGLEHMWTNLIVSWYGESLIDIGDYARAKESLNRALTHQEEAHGIEHPQTVLTILRLGLLHLRLGELNLADQYLQQALLLNQSNLEPEHVDLARNFSLLGELYQAFAENEEAQAYFEKGLAIYAATFPPEHPNIQKIKKSLAELAGL
ncbi:MAG: tetratricopeptide repeat protein, partial [Chloroflexota bacterium]